MPQECMAHDGMNIRIQQIEKVLDELKGGIDKWATKEEVQEKIKYLEREIMDLKEDSQKHYNDNMALQQTLTRLDEFTKYLKESLAANQEQTKQLMEKIDKMYELMLTASSSSKDPRKKEGNATNEIKIINDSNKQNNKSDSGNNEKLMEFLKTNAMSILLLVAAIVFILTGKWPL